MWKEGSIEKKKGRELLVFAQVFQRMGHGERKLVDWRLEDLQYEREENSVLDDVWKFVKGATQSLGTDGVSLDEIFLRMYPNDEPHPAVMWKAWLQVPLGSAVLLVYPVFVSKWVL